MPNRRPFIAFAAACLALAAAGAPGADSTLKAPIRILLPFADEASYSVARQIGETLAEAVGQPVVVERKAGASGRIAAETLKNAAPDGTTLLLAPIVVPVLAPLVFGNPGFDPAKDFAPVAQVATYRYAWAVGPQNPSRTIAQFVAWAKAHPAQANFGTAGAGTIPHFLGVMTGEATGIALTHVPYKGASPMSADLMGDQIASGIDAFANLIELHRAGRIRIIAISGAGRTPVAPDLPTFGEQGFPELSGDGWIAMFAPAGTPKATIDQLSSAVAAALRTRELRERIAAMGAEPAGSTPEALAATMKADTARWGAVIRATGFRAD